MTVDDVQYLVNNSLEDSVQIHVDSDKRDRMFYPTPSEYVIHFPDPIKNVFGLEVIDGTIPSSMYNVDEDTNGLRLIIVNRLPEQFEVSVSIREIIRNIGNSNRFQRYVDDIVPEQLLITSIEKYDSAYAQGFRPAHVDTVQLLTTPHSIAVRGEALDVHLEKNVVPSEVDQSRYAVFQHDGTWYSIRRDIQHSSAQRLIDTIDRESNANVDVGAVNIYTVQSATDSLSTDMYNIVWFSIIETTRDSIENYTVDGHDYLYILECNHISFPVGNYNLSQLERRMGRVLSPYNISARPVNELEINQTYRLSYTSDKQFIFDMEHSSMRRVMGFNEHSNSVSVVKSNLGSNRENRRLAANPDRRANNSMIYGDNMRMFTAEKPEEGSEEDVWRLDTPGIINLIGERYVKLRCPEIEDFLNPMAGDRFGTGFGIFKLAGRNEVSHIRFDFVSVKNKKIHPIGKLGRLTFRFERPDGNLYDFKGVDHHMLINIKIWVPTQKLEFKGSVLNEEYNPDIRAYLNHQYVDPDPAMRGGGDSSLAAGIFGNEEDEDEEDDDPVRDNELPYDYSTDESEYSDEIDTPMVMSLAQAKADSRHNMRR